jgi:hypothetical protein
MALLLQLAARTRLSAEWMSAAISGCRVSSLHISGASSSSRRVRGPVVKLVLLALPIWRDWRAGRSVWAMA